MVLLMRVEAAVLLMIVLLLMLLVMVWGLGVLMFLIWLTWLPCLVLHSRLGWLLLRVLSGASLRSAGKLLRSVKSHGARPSLAMQILRMLHALGIGGQGASDHAGEVGIPARWRTLGHGHGGCLSTGGEPRGI